jgi:hypothetical protein
MLVHIRSVEVRFFQFVCYVMLGNIMSCLVRLGLLS